MEHFRKMNSVVSTAKSPFIGNRNWLDGKLQRPPIVFQNIEKEFWVREMEFESPVRSYLSKMDDLVSTGPPKPHLARNRDYRGRNETKSHVISWNIRKGC